MTSQTQPITSNSTNSPEALGLIPDDAAAAMLGQERRTLALWRSTGRVVLPFCKIGRRIFYRKSDLEAFVSERLRPSGTTEPPHRKEAKA